MLWQRMKALSSLMIVLAMMLAVGAADSRCIAGSISYSDVGPVSGVMFTDIKESSGTDDVPLFGAPTAFSVGLDFDPQGFVATASGGDEDVTDGQLNFTLMSANGIDMINLFEAGDYTLTGTSGAATRAIAGLSLRAIVTQINGVNVAPIDLTPSNASVGFNLAANPGVLQPWSLGTSLDVGAQMANRGRATKVKVVVDNQLIALSGENSLSFIAKKEFRVQMGVIPEPSTVMLAGLVCGSFGLIAGRRRD